MTAAKRPKRIAVGGAIARAVRGPKPDNRSIWYWQCQIARDGSRRTLWSGWGTGQEVTRIIIGLMAAAPDSELEAQPAGAITTVRDLLECWVGSLRARLEVGDLTGYGFRNFRTDSRHLAERLGDVALTDLRKTGMEVYRNQRLAEAAPATVHRELKALRAAWKWARDDEHVPDRDLPEVRVKVTQVRQKYNPTTPECWAVIDQLEGWAKFVAGMLTTTGARVGEIAQLRWEDIHYNSGSLTLRGKNGLRSFPLSDEVLEVLTWGNRDAEYPHGTTPCIVRGHFSSHLLREACEKAVVRRFSSHGFRRAAVDTLQRAGVDIKTAADLLGHSPETMLKYYRAVSDDDRSSAADLLGAASSAVRARAKHANGGLPEDSPHPGGDLLLGNQERHGGGSSRLLAPRDLETTR